MSGLSIRHVGGVPLHQMFLETWVWNWPSLFIQLLNLERWVLRNRIWEGPSRLRVTFIRGHGRLIRPPGPSAEARPGAPGTETVGAAGRGVWGHSGHQCAHRTSS